MNKPFPKNNRNDRSAKRGAKHFVPAEEMEAREGLIFGRNAVKELLASGRDIDKIWTARGDREGSIVVLASEAIARKIPVIEVDRKKLDAMCASEHHQGIAAMAASQEYATVDEILQEAEERGEAPLLVLCDGVEDPHNLGAIIRSAECAGFHGLIIPKRRSAGLTATVAKASAGALSYLKIAKVINLATAIDELQKKGVWIYGADMDGTDYDKTDMKGPMAIVLGNEGEGLSRLVEEKCDFKVCIPLYGKINSMNVSAAAAVLFCEAARQRHKG